MKKNFQYILPLLALCFLSHTALAGPSLRSGWIANHTSVEGTLLIKFDANTAMPDNCVGSPYNWFLIPESNKAIMAVTLLAIASNNRAVTIYTKGIGPSGCCEATQVDPAI